MLHIGSRTFQPLPSQSGIRVLLDPHGREVFQQNWLLDACFVPADDDPGPPPWCGNEFWRFSLGRIIHLTVHDWRELEGKSLIDDEDGFTRPLFPDFTNLCGWGDAKKPRAVLLGECRILKRDGYLFTVEIDGEIETKDEAPADGVTGYFRTIMEIPFAAAEVSVPVNSNDPLASARGIAAREISLKDIARSHVTPFDPERAAGFKGHHFNKHDVDLETPWRRLPHADRA
jgi:hypothetical protein